MAAEALPFLLFVAFAVCAPLVLYALVREEGSRREMESTDWESAERAARRDTADDSDGT